MVNGTLMLFVSRIISRAARMLTCHFLLQNAPSVDDFTVNVSKVLPRKLRTGLLLAQLYPGSPSITSYTQSGIQTHAHTHTYNYTILLILYE